MLSALKNNLPWSKPELWRNLPGSLWRKATYNFRSGIVGASADRTIPMEVNLDDGIGRAIYLYGSWEYPTSDFLDKYLTADMCFIDAGANIGYFTLFAAKRCRIAYGFEPMPTIFQMLRRNLELNSSLNARAYEMAVSDQ